MANTTFQLRRSSVAGKVPNTSTLSTGELGLNLTDKILYSSDGTNIFEVGSNNTNVNISGNLTVKAIKANGSLGTAGQVLASNGTATYWTSPTTGDITGVAAGNGLTGGGTSGDVTVSVLANTGIVANATGVYVNSAYIGTLAANSATYLGGNTASDLRTYSDNKAANAYSNAVSYVDGKSYVNTSQLSSNLANYQTTAGLSANVATLTSNNSTYAFDKTEGNLNVNSAVYANASITNTFTVGTGTYFAANGNVGIGTSSPAYRLDINGETRILNNQFVSGSLEINKFGSGNRYAFIDLVGDDTYTDYGTRLIRNNTGSNTSSVLYHRGTGDLRFTTQEAAPITFYTNNSERVRIDASGNVGIGTSSPGQKLAVSGDTYISGNVGIGAVPSSTASLYITDTFAVDSSTYGLNVTVSDSNTATTATRNKAGSYSIFTNKNQNKSSDGLTTYNSSYFGTLGYVYNGDSDTGGDAYASTLEAARFVTYQYANGSNANTVSSARGVYGIVGQYSSGNITTAQGLRSQISAANNSVTGNIGSAYGVYTNIISNTAMTITTGYLYYGSYLGSTTTNKYGIYLTGETTNYLSGNVGIGNTAPADKLSVNGTTYLQANVTLNAALVANGGAGSAGQVLHSNGTATYWAADDQGVTSITTGEGLIGGTITSTGSISVLANTGIVANITGVYVNSTYIGTLSANAATYLNGKTEGNLNVNSALSSNNSTYAFGKTEGAINANSALTANNADYLDGQHGAYYTNATNITTGTLPYAQIPANIANTTGAFTFSGVHTHNANIILGSSGLSANASFGTAGQVLHSNGTATYWAADDQGVTSVATGNGLTGGTITSTGTISVLANTGIVANITGVYVNSSYIATIASNSATYANSSVTNTFTVGTGTYFVSNGNVGIGTNSPSAKLHVAGNYYQINTADLTPNATWSGHLTIGGNGYSGGLSFDATAMWVGHNSTGRALYLATDETMRVSINGSTGNVGMGVASALGALDVYRASGVVTSYVRSAGSLVSDIASSFTQAGLYSVQHSVYGTGEAYTISNTPSAYRIGTTSANPVFFIANNATKVTVASNGNVGVGTTAPASKLTVQSDSAPQLKIRNDLVDYGVNIGVDLAGNYFYIQKPELAVNSIQVDSTGTLTLNGAGTTIYMTGVVQVSSSHSATDYTASGTITASSLISGGTTSGSSIGVSGYSNSNYGVYGSSRNQSAVVGVSNTGYGVYGISNTSYGVYAYSTSSTGVYGFCAGANFGVRGYGASNYGGYFQSGNNSYAGVIGYSQNASSYGLVGYQTYAFYGSGNLYVSGSIAKGSGSFQIDHPLPSMANTHYLVHSFVEAPTADNIYRGKAKLLNGTAEIDLDKAAFMTEGTFTALNGNLQVFLQNDTGWSPLKAYITGNKLNIICENEISNDTVSWLVIGTRQDKVIMDSNLTDEFGQIIIERPKSMDPQPNPQPVPLETPIPPEETNI